MKRIITLLLVAVCCMGIAKADDIIYLKDGGIVKGELQSYLPGDGATIVTGDGSTKTFTAEEIKSVEVEDPSAEDENGLTRYMARKGYKGSVEVTVVATTYPVKVTTTHGYQFSHSLFVGGGVGVNWDSRKNGDIDVPIYAAIQSNVGKKMAQFTYGAKVGVTAYSKHTFINSMGMEETSQGFGGLYFNINLGLRLGFSPQFAITIKPDLELIYWGLPSLNSGINVGFEF